MAGWDFNCNGSVFNRDLKQANICLNEVMDTFRRRQGDSVSFNLFLCGFSVVLEILNCLYALGQVFSEGHQVIFVDWFYCAFNVVAHKFFIINSLGIALAGSLAASHLSHEFMQQFFLFALEIINRVCDAKTHLIIWLLAGRHSHKIFIALSFLKNFLKRAFFFLKGA